MEKIKKITEILFAQVETENGEKLGHVFELRSKGEPEHGITNKERQISEILYGTTGFWESLGIKEPQLKSIPWSAVRRVGGGKIIVDENSIKGSQSPVNDSGD
jgi:hypothetical protein